jgi:glycosyltransferase involved in cell wall biosynthesis
MMRVVHVPFGWRPGAHGGTEVYVEALAREQRSRGIDARIVAPDAGGGFSAGGVPIAGFPVAPPVDAAELHGDGDDALVAGFWSAVGGSSVDVVHLHAHTRAVSARLAHSARTRGARVVATYHTPTFSCMEGRLLRFGSAPCSGDLGVEPCAACALSAKGVPGTLAKAVAATAACLPSAARSVLPGRARTLAAMPEIVRRRSAAFAALDAALDAWVAPSEWVVELLARNGIATSRVVRCPQGVALRVPDGLARSRREGGPLRIAFVGRHAPEKGLDVLLAALRPLPPGMVEAVLYLTADPGPVPPGVKVHTGREGAELLRDLAGCDLLCVPSQWMETGPLVVLEAFEAGVPVLGSALGGIAERVRDGVDGRLVAAWRSPAAWTAALSALSTDRATLARLRDGVRRPRDMASVADDMAVLYARLLGGEATPRRAGAGH